MYRVAWLEFSKSGKLVMKSRRFADRIRQQAFISKLFKKGNLYQIIACD